MEGITNPRVLKKARDMQQLEEEYPLRRSVLSFLGKKTNSSNKEIAQAVNSDSSNTLMEVERLQKEGLILKANDLYYLSAWGQSQLNDHLAFGALPNLADKLYFHDEILAAEKALNPK